MADTRIAEIIVRITCTENAAIIECDAMKFMVGYLRDDTPWLSGHPWTPDQDATGYSGEENG